MYVTHLKARCFVIEVTQQRSEKLWNLSNPGEIQREYKEKYSLFTWRHGRQRHTRRLLRKDHHHSSAHHHRHCHLRRRRRHYLSTTFTADSNSSITIIDSMIIAFYWSGDQLLTHCDIWILRKWDHVQRSYNFRQLSIWNQRYVKFTWKILYCAWPMVPSYLPLSCITNHKLTNLPSRFVEQNTQAHCLFLLVVFLCHPEKEPMYKTLITYFP